VTPQIKGLKTVQMLAFKNISFKNKILLSTLLVILLLGGGVSLVSRWILIPSLVSQLQQRGLGIARGIAERGRAYILTENIPELTSLIFDTAVLRERRPLITYIFVLDKGNRVLSHTFTYPFPERLRYANTILPEESYSIRLIRLQDQSAYDIAVPILEGIYYIGTVHVGLNKDHIDRLIGRLAAMFLGILAAIIIIGFLLCNLLSRYITRPVSQLTRASDEIGRGNLNISPGVRNEVRCWEIMDCEREDCPAYNNGQIPCWHVDGTLCDETCIGRVSEKLELCKDCSVYKSHLGDEIMQLADSFSNMTIRLKRSETEIRKSEEKYRALFDYGPNSIFVLDTKTFSISDANTRTNMVYGYEKAELIGRSFMDLGPFKYKEGVLAVNGIEPSSMLSVYPKIQHRRKDGSTFFVNVYASKTGPTPKYGIIVTTIDLTEMLAKESQLIQASKMSTLGEMASGIAHEINQPLSAIQIGSDLISNLARQGRAISLSDLRIVADQMREQVDRAVRIINHLREFGRKEEIKREKININKPIEGVFTLLGQQLKLRGIEVVLELEEGLPPIMADVNRLEQVFVDLVVNARDSMEEKEMEFVEGHIEKTLTVRSTKEDGHLVVTITDTGTGIPEEVRDRIFEPFFTTKEVGKGTGLGLSISYGIIKDYEGTIEVESETGKGTTFRLTFPFIDEGSNGE
jgi:PAS domain S-box-containing protein